MRGTAGIVAGAGVGVVAGSLMLVDSRPSCPDEWPPDVRRAEAEADGWKPSDFCHMRWPVEDVEFLNVGGPASGIAMVYSARMPGDVPLANQYVEIMGQGTRKLPDPVGMTLQSVRFVLRDANTGYPLDRNSSLPDDGQVTGYLHNGAEVFRRLQPGGDSIEVVLVAHPEFFFLNEDGGAVSYSTRSNGQFAGMEASSGVHTLALSEEGRILLDGKAR